MWISTNFYNSIVDISIPKQQNLLLTNVGKYVLKFHGGVKVHVANIAEKNHFSAMLASM